MSQTMRPWRGMAQSAFAGLLIVGASVLADEPPPLARQLTNLGLQAVNQNEPVLARSFFKKALELDPQNVDAKRELDKIQKGKRVAFQDPAAKDAAPKDAAAKVAEPKADDPADEPAAPPAAQPIPPAAHIPQATIENQARLESVRRQQLVADIQERLRRARDLVNSGQPEAALDALRLALTVVRSEEGVADDARNALDRQIQAQILSTARDEERIVGERAEALRLAAVAESKLRALNLLERNQETVSAMMTQFDMLMAQGQYNVLYNGGFGNVNATTAPFVDARLLAQRARALAPTAAAPRAGLFLAETSGFLAQELAFEQAKEYRGLLTMQDVARAAVPFPDEKVIEYPDAELWRALSEKRILRYGKAVDLLDRDREKKEKRTAN